MNTTNNSSIARIYTKDDGETKKITFVLDTDANAQAKKDEKKIHFMKSKSSIHRMHLMSSEQDDEDIYDDYENDYDEHENIPIQMHKSQSSMLISIPWDQQISDDEHESIPIKMHKSKSSILIALPLEDQMSYDNDGDDDEPNMLKEIPWDQQVSDDEHESIPIKMHKSKSSIFIALPLEDQMSHGNDDDDADDENNMTRKVTFSESVKPSGMKINLILSKSSTHGMHLSGSSHDDDYDDVDDDDDDDRGRVDNLADDGPNKSIAGIYTQRYNDTNGIAFSTDANAKAEKDERKTHFMKSKSSTHGRHLMSLDQDDDDEDDDDDDDDDYDHEHIPIAMHKSKSRISISEQSQPKLHNPSKYRNTSVPLRTRSCRNGIITTNSKEDFSSGCNEGSGSSSHKVKTGKPGVRKSLLQRSMSNVQKKIDNLSRSFYKGSTTSPSTTASNVRSLIFDAYDEDDILEGEANGGRDQIFRSVVKLFESENNYLQGGPFITKDVSDSRCPNDMKPTSCHIGESNKGCGGYGGCFRMKRGHPATDRLKHDNGQFPLKALNAFQIHDKTRGPSHRTNDIIAQDNQSRRQSAALRGTLLSDAASRRRSLDEARLTLTNSQDDKSRIFMSQQLLQRRIPDADALAAETQITKDHEQNTRAAPEASSTFSRKSLIGTSNHKPPEPTAAASEVPRKGIPGSIRNFRNESGILQFDPDAKEFVYVPKDYSYIKERHTLSELSTPKHQIEGGSISSRRFSFDGGSHADSQNSLYNDVSDNDIAPIQFGGYRGTLKNVTKLHKPTSDDFTSRPISVAGDRLIQFNKPTSEDTMPNYPVVDTYSSSGSLGVGSRTTSYGAKITNPEIRNIFKTIYYGNKIAAKGGRF